MSFNLELAGRRVLITGGSKGVGAALVESLRDAGMAVVATARSVPDTALGGVTYIAADLMTAKGYQAVANAVLERVCGEFQILHIDRASRPRLAAWTPSATMTHARRGVFTYSSHCDHRQTPAAGWRSFHHCRVAAAQTSAVDSQSIARRAPNLRSFDRLIAGLCTDLMRRARLLRAAIVLRPATLMKFHDALVKRKYRWLFTPKRRRKPGPKGPGPELVAAIVEMKRRNPRFGCRRIAQQIAFVFGVEIDKDVVRRVLAKHCRPTGGSDGPSWLTLLGHAKDSLWSVDLFRCESLILKTNWVMVVMDQFTRRIIGFAVQPGVVDGPALCRMFNRVIAGTPTLPQYLSSDHDPLFTFHRWQANLRILDVSEIKTVPHVPVSHPFVERLIGTVRRELLDQIPFWGASDLERKLLQFRDYFNEDRVHASLDGRTPICKAAGKGRSVIDINAYQWRSHCRGLYQLPAAA